MKERTTQLGGALARTVHDLWSVPCPLTHSALVDLDDALSDVADPVELLRFVYRLHQCLQEAPDPAQRKLLGPMLDALSGTGSIEMDALRAAYRDALSRSRLSSINA